MKRPMLPQAGNATSSGTCAVCRFWQMSGSHRGQCRYSPPQSRVIGGMDADLIELCTVWPLTNEHDWCGRFIPVTSYGARRSVDTHSAWEGKL